MTLNDNNVWCHIIVEFNKQSSCFGVYPTSISLEYLRPEFVEVLFVYLTNSQLQVCQAACSTLAKVPST